MENRAFTDRGDVKMIFLGSVVSSGIAQENVAQISANKIIETDVPYKLLCSMHTNS